MHTYPFSTKAFVACLQLKDGMLHPISPNAIQIIGDQLLGPR